MHLALAIRLLFVLLALVVNALLALEHVGVVLEGSEFIGLRLPHLLVIGMGIYVLIGLRERGWHWNGVVPRHQGVGLICRQERRVVGVE